MNDVKDDIQDDIQNDIQNDIKDDIQDDTEDNRISRGFPEMTLKGTWKGTSCQVRSRSGPGQV